MQLSRKMIEKNWPLTAVSVRQISRQLGQRAVSIVAAAEGQFFVKHCDQWRSSEVAEKHAFIFDFLQESNFRHVPTLLRTKTGTSYCQIDNQSVCVLEFIPGSAPVRTKETCSQIGEIAAELHMIRDYTHDCLFTVADGIPEFSQIAETLAFDAMYAEIVKTLPDLQDLPVSLIHGEIFGNCVQKPDRTIIVVDWDEAGVGTRILDLGHPLIQVFLSTDLEFEEENARAFYQSYFNKIDLDDKEIERIFDAGLFYALRYIIYGDTDKRWERIKYAVKHRGWFESMIRDCARNAMTHR